MNTINVRNNQVTPVIDNWKDSFDKAYGVLQKLPQVTSGSVKLTNAAKWLELASKVHPQINVFRLLNQVRTIGAKDMRTLIATDRNEYFPKDSVKEVFQRKMLDTIPMPNTKEFEKEKLLCKVARALLLKKYDLTRDAELEQKMSSPETAKIPWLCGTPGMVAKSNGAMHLFDIQITANSDSLSESDKIAEHPHLEPEVLNESDKIAPHYYDMIANNHGVTIDNISVVKIHLDKKMTENLIQLSSLSKDSQKAVDAIIDSMHSLPKETLNVCVHTIEKKPALYKEIGAAGKKYWNKIISGELPAIKQDPPLQLPDAKNNDYTEKAKKFLAATLARRSAEELEKKACNEFVSTVRGFDISDNFSPPYYGALLRKYDKFDKEGAAKYLEQNFGVQPAHLRVGTMNTEMLAQAYKSMGGNPNQFIEYKAADKAKTLNTAEELGIDLSGFKERNMRAVVNPKTRGPIFEALQAIKGELQPDLESLNSKVSQSNVMDNHNLTKGTKQEEINVSSKPRMGI